MAHGVDENFGPACLKKIHQPPDQHNIPKIPGLVAGTDKYFFGFHYSERKSTCGADTELGAKRGYGICAASRLDKGEEDER